MGKKAASEIARNNRSMLFDNFFNGAFPYVGVYFLRFLEIGVAKYV